MVLLKSSPEESLILLAVSVRVSVIIQKSMGYFGGRARPIVVSRVSVEPDFFVSAKLADALENRPSRHIFL